MPLQLYSRHVLRPRQFANIPLVVGYRRYLLRSYCRPTGFTSPSCHPRRIPKGTGLHKLRSNDTEFIPKQIDIIPAAPSVLPYAVKVKASADIIGSVQVHRSPFSRQSSGYGQFSLYVEVIRSRRRCHSLDEADWETRKEAPLTAWKEFSRVRFLRYGRDRVDLIVDFVASSYLVANWNRKSYSMQSLSCPPGPNGDRSYRGKWWPFPNLIG